MDDDVEFLDIFDNNKKKDTEVSRVSKLNNNSNNKNEEKCYSNIILYS